ncbi:MAG: hypothetical protein AVDCRST_MAG32-2647, partial [uncultured Nocardioides sp.]
VDPHRPRRRLGRLHASPRCHTHVRAGADRHLALVRAGPGRHVQPPGPGPGRPARPRCRGPPDGGGRRLPRRAALGLPERRGGREPDPHAMAGHDDPALRPRRVRGHRVDRRRLRRERGRLPHLRRRRRDLAGADGAPRVARRPTCRQGRRRAGARRTPLRPARGLRRRM